jgi:hypothetical protein
LTKSSEAETKADAAKTTSGKAVAESSSAMTIASGARQEADSFEQDIVSAKTQAAEAESHLAEALGKAARAQEELNRFKTPRSLTSIPELIAALEPFKGTEYVFTSVFQDEESMRLVEAINSALKDAGWKRGKSVGGFPGVTFHGKDTSDLSVAIGFNIGIRVWVESPRLLTLIRKSRTCPSMYERA